MTSEDKARAEASAAKIAQARDIRLELAGRLGLLPGDPSLVVIFSTAIAISLSENAPHLDGLADMVENIADGIEDMATALKGFPIIKRSGK